MHFIWLSYWHGTAKIKAANHTSQCRSTYDLRPAKVRRWTSAASSLAQQEAAPCHEALLPPSSWPRAGNYFFLQRSPLRLLKTALCCSGFAYWCLYQAFSTFHKWICSIYCPVVAKQDYLLSEIVHYHSPKRHTRETVILLIWVEMENCIAQVPTASIPALFPNSLWKAILITFCDKL